MDPNSILITNAYTWYNKGDASIIIAMIKALREQWPNVRIAILSMTPDIDEFHYQKLKVEVCSEFFGDILNSNKSKIFKILEILKITVQVVFLIILYKLLYKLRVEPKENPTLRGSVTLRKYFDADIVISSGGGFLNDNFGSVFLLHLFQIFVAIILRKPTVLCAQSIGPFKSKLHLFLTKIVLNKVDLITVREVISGKLLTEMKVNPYIRYSRHVLCPFYRKQ